MRETGTRKLVLQICVASALMAAFLVIFGGSVTTWLSTSTTRRLIWISWLVIGGSAIYFVALWIMGVRFEQFRLRGPAPAPAAA